MFAEHYFNKLYLYGIYFSRNRQTATIIQKLNIHTLDEDLVRKIYIVSRHSHDYKQLVLRPFYRALRVYIPTEHVETLLTYILLNSEAVFHFIEEVGVKR